MWGVLVQPLWYSSLSAHSPVGQAGPRPKRYNITQITLLWIKTKNTYKFYNCNIVFCRGLKILSFQRFLILVVDLKRWIKHSHSHLYQKVALQPNASIKNHHLSAQIILTSIHQLCIKPYRPLALCSVGSAEQCPVHPLAPGWGHACCRGNSVLSHPLWTAGRRSEAC